MGCDSSANPFGQGALQADYHRYFTGDVSRQVDGPSGAGDAVARRRSPVPLTSNSIALPSNTCFPDATTIASREMKPLFLMISWQCTHATPSARDQACMRACTSCCAETETVSPSTPIN